MVAGRGSIQSKTPDPFEWPAVQGPDNATSILVSWKYLGSDATGIELEMEDQSAGENFHTVSTNGATTDSTGKTTITFASLIGGDSYQFRIRADHADGSVSDYVTADPVVISMPDAPSINVSIVTIDNKQYVHVGWSRAGAGVQIEAQSSALPGSDQWYNLGYGDDYYFPPSLNHAAGDGDQGYALDPGAIGYPSGTYTYRVRSFDSNFHDTEWSSPSSPVTLTSTDPLPTATNLTLTSTDTSITATWPISDDYTVLYFEQKGVNSFIDNDLGLEWSCGTGTPDYSDGIATKTLGGLKPGTIYDFVLWTMDLGGDANEDGNGVVATAFTKVSIATAGTVQVAPPAAPAFAHAIYDPSVSGGQIKLSWANTPNNETNFILQYAVTTYVHGTPATSWRSFAYPSADVTSYVFNPQDYPSKNGPYYFRIYAQSNSGISSGYATASCTAIGGPDITSHLQGIRIGVMSYGVNILQPLFNQSIQVQLSNWDIVNLAGKAVTTPHNDGIIPDGTHTVTVAGAVYPDADVNYWLYGCWVAAAGLSYDTTYQKVFLHGSMTQEGADGKLAWFNAGYYGSFSYAASDAIPNIAPAAAPPTGEDPGRLEWQIGGDDDVVPHIAGIDMWDQYSSRS